MDGKYSISFVEVDGTKIIASLTYICGGTCLFSVYNRGSELLDRYKEILDKLQLGYKLPISNKYKHSLRMNSATDKLVISNANEFYIVPKFIYAITFGADRKSGIAVTDDVVKHLIKTRELVELEILNDSGVRFASIVKRDNSISLDISDFGLRVYSLAEFRKWLRWYNEM